MRAIISVFGLDDVGILKNITSEITDNNLNIIDIRQSLVDKYFTMTMIVGFEKATCTLQNFIKDMSKLGKKMNLEIKVMHQDIFEVTHKI